MERAWVSTAMTLGQWPEIVALAALPWLIRRLGYGPTLVLGIAAYVVRFGSLAAEPSQLYEENAAEASAISPEDLLPSPQHRRPGSGL